MHTRMHECIHTTVCQYDAKSLLNKKLCYHRGTAQHAMSVEILSTAAQLYKKSHLKCLQYGMTLKLIQGHWNCLCTMDHI